MANGTILNSVIQVLFSSCKRNILYDIFNCIHIHILSYSALFLLNQIFSSIRSRRDPILLRTPTMEFYKGVYQVGYHYGINSSRVKSSVSLRFRNLTSIVMGILKCVLELLALSFIICMIRNILNILPHIS